MILGKILKLPLALLLTVLLIRGILAASLYAQDRLPVREYTNPDEMVTFDRTTPFPRALDVINEFAQEHLGKIILDQTNTGGPIGISIPPMHWRDALDMILRLKELQLVERPDIFEIVIPQPEEGQVVRTTGGQQQAQDGQAQEEVLATLDTREVRINAIFFEGNRRALREIGVDWSTLSENVPTNLPDFIEGDNLEPIPVTEGFNNQFVSVNSKGASSVSQNVFNALVNFGQLGTTGIEVQALFSAFEADNLGEILASPSIKVIDGQEGNIQVGQDFSVKQRDFAGNVTDQFFSVGTILTVTPTVIEQSDTTFIHLNIAAERSSAQPDPVSTVITKQEATTQAILLDGEATAIAGLYRTETSEVRRGIPILKDLPPWFFGLRYLFGFNSYDHLMRELVILVQAEIEPSIPERYGDDHASKFTVLNRSRQRIRSEIKEYEETEPSDLMEDVENIDEIEDKAAEAEEELEQEQASNGEEEGMIEEQPEQDDAAEDTLQNQQEGVVDPEIDLKPVPLNLGGEAEQREQQEDSAAAEMDQSLMNTADSTKMANANAREKVKQPSNGSSADAKYFIIGASFMLEGNAVDYRDQLIKDGFKAVILTKPDSQFHYVAYRGYTSSQDARTGLADIRQYYNSKAWLFTKN